MAKMVLTADETLTSTFRNIPLADFMGCMPCTGPLRWIYKIFDSQLPHEGGALSIAPYSLRKLEAALLSSGYSEKELVVAHPKYLDRFIDEETEVVGISTMDPFGLGPLTFMLTYGGIYESHTAAKFKELTKKLSRIRDRKGLKFKVVVGGQGAWQLLRFQEEARSLGIDHVVLGEIDHVAGDLFRRIACGSADWVLSPRSYPSVDQIPTIIRPAYKGMVEAMRGCGRGCTFCSPNVRSARYMPVEQVLKEVSVNVRGGLRRAWVHGDDIFLYELTDRKYFYPNTEAVTGLFRSIMTKTGVFESNPTHGSIAPVVADPDLLPSISDVLGASPRHWIGIQPGIETASARLIEMHMRNKTKPFSPEEWPEVVVEGTYIFNLNYWFPAYTIIVGLPGETEEDAWETARLIVTMNKVIRRDLGSKAHFTITPLAFVPAGVLEGKNFFNASESVTEARFQVIYQCWRTVVREVQHSLSMFKWGNSLLRVILNPLIKFGSSAVLDHIRSWGRRRGFDPDKKVEPLELKIYLP